MTLPWHRLAIAALFATVLCGDASGLQAQMIETDTIVPGERYQAGWLRRFLFGSEYRDLWTTPIEVPVLDLRTYAGGLTPVRRGGFGQTSSLHFDAPDGTRHVFRSVDKDPSRRLAEELQGSFIASIIQDQISALNPGAALVVAPLLNAAGVLNAQPALFVMPDDPLLGEFREEFAQTLGLMMVNPDEGVDNAPGFAGARVISGSERAFEDVEDGPDNRFDRRAFLKARLLDAFLGDRDRHMGQWRWARFETDTGFVWVPIPEDRDQAFIHQDGLMMWATRKFFTRKFVAFAAEYPPIEAITWNGWDLDRYLLTELSRAVWDSVALDLQRRLSDSVIAHAVQMLPAAFYERKGSWLTRALQARRDALVNVAREYYLMLSGEAEIRGTDIDELALIDWVNDTTLQVTLRPRGPEQQNAAPHFSRNFVTSETKEIRVFLHGGDDRVEVTGRGRGITVRVIGGGGADEFVDASSGAVFFYDAGNRSSFERGAGTRVDRRDFEAPPSTDPAHEHPPDWGSWTRPIPILSYSPDIGVYAGFGVVQDRYGFRSFPFKTKMWFRGAWASAAAVPTVEFQGDFRNVGRNLHASLDIGISGIEIIRFHGFGNETGRPGISEFHEVERVQTRIVPSLVYSAGPSFEFALAPVFKYGRVDPDSMTLLDAVAPYGIGSFGQVGGRARVMSRLASGTRNRDVTASLEGTIYPAVWDVVDVFGVVDGVIRARVGNIATSPEFAVRAGGRKVLGSSFPFHEAAFLGGGTTVRGYAEQRFAGDASLYGNAELRIPIGTFPFILPTRFGVMGLGDIGRVFVDAETSDRWHGAFGGGLFFSMIAPENTLSISMAHSEERTGVYVRAGFMF